MTVATQLEILGHRHFSARRCALCSKPSRASGSRAYVGTTRAPPSSSSNTSTPASCPASSPSTEDVSAASPSASTKARRPSSATPLPSRTTRAGTQDTQLLLHQLSSSCSIPHDPAGRSQLLLYDAGSIDGPSSPPASPCTPASLWSTTSHRTSPRPGPRTARRTSNS